MCQSNSLWMDENMDEKMCGACVNLTRKGGYGGGLSLTYYEDLDAIFSVQLRGTAMFGMQ